MSEQEPLLSATRKRFSDLMPKLTAEAGRPVPDLDRQLPPPGLARPAAKQWPGIATRAG